MIFVVDGDFLCYHQAHAMQSKGRKLETYTTIEYVKNCLRTLNYFMTSHLGNSVDLVLFPFDDQKPWRYEYLRQQGIAYKDREETKRELVNFDSYRSAMRDTLAKYKLPVITCPGMEADDIIHKTVDRISDGEVCIMTGDSDMQQKMISTDRKEVFIFNPHDKEFPLLRTVYQPKKEQAVVEADFFESDIGSSKFIDEARNVKVVDPAQGLFVKIISGDGTDTIPSAFKHTYGGVNKTVGKDRAKSFHRELDPVPTVDDVKRMYSSRDERVNLVRDIIAYAKLKAFDKINDFELGILRNIKCILLDDVVYDAGLLEKLEAVVDSHLKQPSPGADLAKIFRSTEFDFSTNYFNY